jgi:hypothetical protein
MDPNQRLIWLREHPLPNKTPFKLILTDAQDLTRRQIDRIKRLKRPKLFYAQPSKNQLDSKHTETDSQSPLPVPYLSSTDEYSDSESSGSDIKEPLD